MNELYQNTTLIVTVGFAVGAVFGSFLNVCVYRIPIYKSIISPSSHCPECGLDIPWYRNIPIFTWLLQNGMAKCCSYKIPIRYWILEFLMGILFGYFAYKYSKNLDLLVLFTHAFFTWLMIAVAVIDFETMTIPDRFSLGGAVSGVVLSCYFPQMHMEVFEVNLLNHLSSGLHSLLGMLIGSAFIYWIGAIAHVFFGREALGEGDVKLLGCVGAFCGWQGALFTIFAGALLGTILILPILLIKHFGKLGSKNGSFEIRWGGEIPFGPFLAIAGVFYFVYAYDYVDNWLSPIELIF